MLLSVEGIVEKGLGYHSRLHIPGSKEIDSAPDDWPIQFASGSLNIFVPTLPQEVSGRQGFKALDKGKFPAAFSIPQHAIGNNSLRKKFFKPRRGTGQAWRAILSAKAGTQNVWVFRRIGSHMRYHLELISPFILREQLRLSDGDRVKLTMVDKFELGHL